MKKRIISLLLALTLCLGLLPAPVFAEEAPTTQTLEETPVSQNEEPQEPQPEPTPQNQEGQTAQEEQPPQSQEGQQPQPEPTPQDEETPQPPQGEPEQEEPPVRGPLKANAPMAVAEEKTGKEVTLTVGPQEGKLFAGVDGEARFTVTGENVDWTSLDASFGEDVYGLSALVTCEGTTGNVTVMATGDAKEGTYTLTLGEGIAIASVKVDAPFTIKNKDIQVVADQTSATLTLEVDVAQELEGQVQYTWMPDGKESVVTKTNTVTLYPDHLKQEETRPGRYSAWVDCRVSCGTYYETAIRRPVTIIACDHSGAILYTKEGACRGCGQRCPEDRPLITGDGEAIPIPQNADTPFALDDYFPGTLYLWEDYTAGRALCVGTLNGEGTLELQGYDVGSKLILDDFQGHSFTIQNGSLRYLDLTPEAGSLVLENVIIENSLTVPAGMDLEIKNNVEFVNPVSFYGPAKLTGGTFDAGLSCVDEQHSCLELLAQGYAFAQEDGTVIDASGDGITGKAQVVPHTCTYVADEAGQAVKCACGRSCSHESLDEGFCTVCKMLVEPFAIGEQGYCSLEDAQNAAREGQTICLRGDYALPNSDVVISKNIILDLNGKTLHGSFKPTGSLTIQDSSSQKTGKIESLVAGQGTEISGGSFGSIQATDPATLQSILADSCYYADEAGTVISVQKTDHQLQNVRVALCDHTSVREIDIGYGQKQYKCNCGEKTYRLTVTVEDGVPQYFSDYNDGFAAAKDRGVVRFLQIGANDTLTVDVQGTVTIDMEGNFFYSVSNTRNLVIKSGSTVRLVGLGVNEFGAEGGSSGNITYGDFIPVTVESGGNFILPAKNLDDKPNMARPTSLTVQSGGTAELHGGSTQGTAVYGTLNISGGSHMNIYQYDSGQLNITGGQIKQLQIYGDIPQNALSGGSYDTISVRESKPGEFQKFRDVTFTDFQKMLASGKVFQNIQNQSYPNEVKKDPNYGIYGMNYAKELENVNVTAAPFTGVQVVCQLGKKEYPGSVNTVYGEQEQDFCLKAQLEEPSAQTQSVTYQWYQLQGETKTPLGTGETQKLDENLALGQYTYQVTAKCHGYELTSEAFTVTVTKAPQTVAVEEMLQALPDKAQPWERTLEDTKIIPARSAYDSLTAVQKGTVEQRLLEKLEALEAELKKWSVTQGDGQTWARGSGKDLCFTLGGQARKLTSLAIDGKVLKEENYEVQDTLDAPFPLSLSAEYLQALQPGTYTLEACFGTESAPKVTFTVETPDTYLDVTGGELAGNTTVTVNGVTYPVEELGKNSYVNLPETGDLLTAYNYHTGSESQSQDNYPAQMQVYRIIREETGARLERVYELDNLLQYAGCSIRLNGTKGIRMITSVDEKVKNALTGAGLAGFTLEEYGTVVMRGEGIPTLETGSHNYAYKRGVNDPVFATVNGRCQYTNVLVGFTMEDCKQTLTLRPYIILKDQAGVLYTLYGGCVSRSIGYIAKQNENSYKPGTEGYRYVHEIIDAVYGQG